MIKWLRYTILLWNRKFIRCKLPLTKWIIICSGQMLELLFHLEYFCLTFNNCLKVIQLVIEQLNTKLSETLIPIFIIIKCSNIIILQSVNMVKIEHRGTLGCVKRNIIKTPISSSYYIYTYSNLSSMLRTDFSISSTFFCSLLFSVCSFYS